MQDYQNPESTKLLEQLMIYSICEHFLLLERKKIGLGQLKKDGQLPKLRVIHSDLKRGFIRAEVIAYDDL
jgi:ribosome-binding ATPase YchF (GTP1/OBG family)